MVEIQSIEPSAYAEQIVALWNSRAASSFPLDLRLLRQQLRLGREPSLCLGAFDEGGGRLVGAALGKRAIRPAIDGSVPEEGYLSFIVVAESAERRGLGSAMLGALEDWLRGLGAKRLRAGTEPYHFFPGQPLGEERAFTALGAFLDARGFSLGGSEEDLIADLGALDLPALAAAAPLRPGYRFRLYEPAIRGGAEEFFAAEFPGRWRIDTLEALDAGMRDIDLALLQEESGRIVGFSRIYEDASPILGPGVYWRAAMRPPQGALGPIGVARSERGKGLGLALLRLCVEELAGRGVRDMVIDWTGLGAFYAKMGFRPWRRYRMREKRLVR